MDTTSHMTSSSLYMRYMDKAGATHVMHHRVWDAERFVLSRRAQAQKDGGTAERISSSQYREATEVRP